MRGQLLRVVRPANGAMSAGFWFGLFGLELSVLRTAVSRRSSVQYRRTLQVKAFVQSEPGTDDVFSGFVFSSSLSYQLYPMVLRRLGARGAQDYVVHYHLI